MKCVYELTYTKDSQGWGYIITTPSGNNVSGGYPTKRMAKKATREIIDCILNDHNGIQVKGRKSVCFKKLDKL